MESTTSKLEQRFARSLASNDKRTRSRALRRLSQWIVARSSLEDGFNELEFLKLWKGLYMCMWHSDKPLVQEELAGNLASLLVAMKRTDMALLCVKTFFRTMAREWHSIDRLRLDKFYMLIRKMVGQSFKMLQKCHWEEEAVMEFVSVMVDGPLNHDLAKTTLGIQLHVLDVFLPELLSCCPDVDNVVQLLQPSLTLLAKTTDPTIAGCVVKCMLEPLDPPTLDQLQVSQEALSDSLRCLAIDRATLGRNRKMLYAHCKRFSSEDCSAPDSGCGLPQPKKIKRKSKGKKKRRKV